MKLKYCCKVYDRVGDEFTTLSAGQKIDVIEVNKRYVKIEWEKDDGTWKYGYIGHKQFMIVV